MQIFSLISISRWIVLFCRVPPSASGSRERYDGRRQSLSQKCAMLRYNSKTRKTPFKRKITNEQQGFLLFSNHNRWNISCFVAPSWNKVYNKVWNMKKNVENGWVFYLAALFFRRRRRHFRLISCSRELVNAFRSVRWINFHFYFTTNVE